MKKLLILTITVTISVCTYAQNIDTISIRQTPAAQDATILSLPCSATFAQGTRYCADSNALVHAADRGWAAASAWTYGGVPANERYLNKFDLSAYSSRAQELLSATLYLYHTQAAHTGNNSATLARVNQSWTENGVTWNNKPTLDTATNDLSKKINIPATVNDSQNFVINMTAMVRYWLQNPNNNHGFMVHLNDESILKSINFATSDHSDTSFRPKMVLVFDPSLNTSLNDRLPDVEKVKVYPNPATDRIQIESSAIVQNILISDLSGRVFKQSVESKMFVGDLSAGVYIINIQTNAGSTQRKFIKQDN